jgi:hypothetical protein
VRGRGLAAVWAAILVAATGPWALAQQGADIERARRQFGQAVNLMKRREWRAGAQALEAPELAGFKNTLWNLVECYRRLQRPADAVRALRRFLAHPRITPEERAIGHNELEALSGAVARLEVRTSVPGVPVFIDGSEVGRAPVAAEVDPGPHVVEVTAPEYEGYRQRHVVVAGQRATVVARLVLRRGELTLSTRPAGARVLLSGQPVGSAPITLPIGAGTHRVEARSQGHRPAARTLSVEPGQKLKLELSLVPEEARLSVTSEVAGARVSLGETELGPAPVVLHPVRPGLQEVTVERKGYQPYRTSLTLSDGQEGRLSVRLGRGRLRPLAFAVAATVAVAGLAGGAVLLSQGQGLASDYDRSLVQLGDNPPYPALIRLKMEALGLARSSDQRFAAGTALLVTGGVALAAAAVLAYFTRWSSSTGRVSVEPLPVAP